VPNIRPSKAPSIPIADREYSPNTTEQRNNALRQYFVQVDNANGQLIQYANNVNTLLWLGDIS
jgi:hypothetical protein